MELPPLMARKAVKVAQEGGDFGGYFKGVELPKVEFAMPKGVELPKVSMPDLPKGVEMPKAEFAMPKRVSMPDLPKVDIPLPDVSGLSSNVSSNVSALKSSGGALVDREVAAVVEGIRAAGDAVLSQVPPGVREQVVRVGDLLGD